MFHSSKTLKNNTPAGNWNAAHSPTGEGFCRDFTLLRGTFIRYESLTQGLEKYLPTLELSRSKTSREARRLLGIQELDGKIAIIEMAQASGLEQLPLVSATMAH